MKARTNTSTNKASKANPVVVDAAAKKANRAPRKPRVKAGDLKSKPGQAVDLEISADTMEAQEVAAQVAATPAPATKATRGAVKQQVLNAADAAYKLMDSAATSKDILAMRLGVMDMLVAQGVKRTTASCMLGEWQKTLPAHQQLAARK
jgi:hypothetical protein